MSNLSHNERIDKAIEDLNSSDKLNYAATARKWGIERTTLAKRHKGQTGTHNAATSEYRKKLSDAQELELLKHIRVLNDRGLPPTPRLIRNIAAEIAGVSVGKNWVTRFCDRHFDTLLNVYLRTIDHSRKIADNSRYFDHYFNTVRMLFYFLRSLLLGVPR
jgi:hypothetical protein